MLKEKTPLDNSSIICPPLSNCRSSYLGEGCARSYLQSEGLEERPLRSSPGVGGEDLDEVLGGGVQAADVERRLVRRDVQHHEAAGGVVHLYERGNFFQLVQTMAKNLPPFASLYHA